MTILFYYDCVVRWPHTYCGTAASPSRTISHQGLLELTLTLTLTPILTYP